MKHPAATPQLRRQPQDAVQSIIIGEPSLKMYAPGEQRGRSCKIFRRSRSIAFHPPTTDFGRSGKTVI